MFMVGVLSSGHCDDVRRVGFCGSVSIFEGLDSVIILGLEGSVTVFVVLVVACASPLVFM